MSLQSTAAAGNRRKFGGRILDIERTDVVISRSEGSTPNRFIDVSPLLRRSVGTVLVALAVKLGGAAAIASALDVRTRIQRMWVLPVLAYDTGGRLFTKITSRSTLAMSAALVVAFLLVLLRHSRQQRIAGSAVGVLGATNALLVDLLLERRWGNYVESSTVHWNVLVIAVGWLLVAAWLAIDRPWRLLRSANDESVTPA